MRRRSALPSRCWGRHALVPYLAGEPVVDNPPLVYVVAAGTGKALSPLLPLHDAARLAAVLILGPSALVLLAARRGPSWTVDSPWMAVLLFLGSVGLWERAHQLSPELGLMLGMPPRSMDLPSPCDDPSPEAPCSASVRA